MSSNHQIGIMQGRLSPQVGDSIQSFPVFTWRDEFSRASEAGLFYIEWIYETETDRFNPLRTETGLKEIQKLVHEWSVQVKSVCADYYMKSHLITSSGVPDPSVRRHLEWLVGRASSLGCDYMILPFVDSSSLKTKNHVLGLKNLLGELIPVLEKNAIEIHLETDLHPVVLTGILRELDHPLIKSNYDIGNSAALGNDPRQELPRLKGCLGSVHVKDRILGGHTVPLGYGTADFSYCFTLFKALSYKRPYILQTARDPTVPETALAIRNRKFVETFL